MKTVAYTALHYGLETLPYAVRSVIDYVDEMWFIYSPVGSHGHRSDILCPEHGAELYEAARKAAGDKFNWYADTWQTEGAQRETIYQLAPDADIILVLDADEIWPDGLAQQAIETAQTMTAAYLRVPIIHFWRSFHRAVLHDPAYPTRVIRRHVETEGEMTLSTPLRIAHLGYAQDSRIVEYKQVVHGHKNEWRKDCDWFRDIFMNAERVRDLHPVGSEHWNTEPVNPDDYFPAFMKEHPHYHANIIP